MKLDIEGKRALVTGASSGLGEAIAYALAAEGAVVVVNGRDRARTEATASGIEKSGGKAIPAVGDLQSSEGCISVAKVAEEALGGIDILVNNAGGTIREDHPAWNEIRAQDYLDSLAINFLAATRLAGLLAPAMVERGWGRIINISSAAARHRVGGLHDYGAAKAALENWSLNLSANLSPHGVTVNSIAPGLILTAGAQSYMETLRDQLDWPHDQAEMERRTTTDLLGQTIPRLGRPEQIGAAVLLLASPLSDFTTGAVWRIDGGVSRGI